MNECDLMKNLYPGVNPHFNSRLQSPNGGWLSFHNSFIERLADHLQDVLPPGYIAYTEASLQIQRASSPERTFGEKSRRTGPDILVAQRRERPASAGIQEAARLSTPTLTLPFITDVREDEPNEAAIVISIPDAPGSVGKPVTRIEILSPGNKPGGGHYPTYKRNRADTMEAGISLIEIDLLHESPPMIAEIPSYPARDPGAYAYSVLVSDPRPADADGIIEVYGFGVADALPIIRMPLDGAEWSPVDLHAVYQTTYQRREYYGLLTVYAEKPARFETYAPADQDFIIRRMAEIAAAAPTEPLT
jgi:hypothetical protein